MSYLLNSATDISLRAKKLRADEIEIYDPVTDEFVPVVPGGNSEGGEVPSYVQPTLIDFGTDRTHITQSKIELGGLSTSGLFKTEITPSGVGITNSGGEHIKVDGGALFYKKNVETPEETIAYEDIAEVVDKIKPIEYLQPTKIDMTAAGSGSEVATFKTTSGGGTIFTPYRLKITGANVANTDDVVLDRTQLLFQEQPDNYTRITAAGSISKRTPEGIKSFTILNAEKVVNSLKDIEYLQPTKIDITGDTSNYPIYIRGNGTDRHARLKYDALEVMRPETGTYSSLANSTLRFYRTDGSYVSYTSTNLGYRPSGASNFTGALIEDVVSVTNKFKNVTAALATINNINNKFAFSASNPNLTSTNIQDSLLKMKDIASTAAQIDAAVASSGENVYPYLKPTSIDLTVTDVPYPIEVKKAGNSNFTRIKNDSVEVVNGSDYNSVLKPHILYIYRPDGGYVAYAHSTIAYKPSPTESLREASTSDVVDVTNRLKDVTANSNDISTAVSTNRIKYRSIGVETISPIRFHTSTSGMTFANTIKVPRTPGKYAIMLTGPDWGTIGVGSSRTFYFMGSNDFITVDAMINQNSDSTGRLLVTPVMKSGSIGGGDGYTSCKFELHNANSGSSWDLAGTILMFTNHGLLIDYDEWVLE